MNIKHTLAALVATSAVTVATAQTGSDSCMTPDPLMGQGSFAFDSTLATTGVEGQTEALCYFFASSTVDNDVWFSWTSDFTGQADIETCNLTAFDTKIAAYPGGGCPTVGTALACNDDDCGLQSKVSMAVTNGTSYMLQIGSFPGAAGGTGSVTISQFVVPPAPPEDDCNTPNAIAGQGSFAFNNTNATTGVEGQAETLCYAFGTSAMNNDIWFSWTADATGTAIIGTCTATLDTRLASYPGGGCPTTGTSLACNDDFCGLQSTITFPVTNGTSYMIQLGTFSAAAFGSGNMDITIGNPPANDDCTAPVAIAGQGAFPFDNTLATAGAEGQAETTCYLGGSSAVDSDVWYSWTSDFTGTAMISTCNSTVDTKIAAYPGGGCPTTGSSLACNDDSCGLQSSMTMAVTNGTSYMLQLGVSPGAAGGTGTFDIIQFVPAAGDDCAAPIAVAGQGSFPYDNNNSSTGSEGQAETNCYSFGTSAVNNDLWFSWTADATGPATVSTCSNTFDTKIAAYPGGGCPTTGTSLACNDDSCGLQSEITFNVVAGTSYMLQIGTFSAATFGTGTFDVSIVGPAEPGVGYCFCDGGNAPCGNGGATGNGCANGSDLNGANLTGSGTASVGSDSLVLSSTGLAPNQPGLYFQGNNAVNGGAGIVFGDGLRCAGQGVVRLGVAVADVSGASDTSGFATQISVKGGVTAGDLKFYQLWYRDPQGSPCGALFNLTNGYQIQW